MLDPCPCEAITLCGGVEAILGLLEQDDDDMSLLRPAMDTLWNLTFEEESVDRVTSAGGIRRLFEVMRKQALNDGSWRISSECMSCSAVPPLPFDFPLTSLVVVVVCCWYFVQFNSEFFLSLYLS